MRIYVFLADDKVIPAIWKFLDFEYLAYSEKSWWFINNIFIVGKEIEINKMKHSLLAIFVLLFAVSISCAPQISNNGKRLAFTSWILRFNNTFSNTCLLEWNVGKRDALLDSMIESLEIQVYGQKMNDDMKYFALQTANEALIKKKIENYSEAEAFISKKFNGKYGNDWHCMVGRVARLAIDRIEFYLTISIKGVHVMVYKPFKFNWSFTMS